MTKPRISSLFVQSNTVYLRNFYLYLFSLLLATGWHPVICTWRVLLTHSSRNEQLGCLQFFPLQTHSCTDLYLPAQAFLWKHYSEIVGCRVSIHLIALRVIELVFRIIIAICTPSRKKEVWPNNCSWLCVGAGLTLVRLFTLELQETVQGAHLGQNEVPERLGRKFGC